MVKHALQQLTLVSLLALAGMPATASAADPALERASTAMGANGLNTLRYAGDGIGFTFGQAYKPDLPWPKIRVQSFVRSVNYETGSMKEEITFNRAEGLGGGGYGSVKFPTRIEQSAAGSPVLDLTVKDVQPNAPADISLPDAVKNATERITADKVAEGVWFISGASHNSVVIEMKDYVIVVETPLNDGRSVPVLAQVKQLVPGKPIRYVINSHTHFDHSGGLRAAVAEGATIITHAQNKPYYERAFAVKNTINPDQLAKSGKKAQFIVVDEKKVLTDGTRSVEIHHVADSHHTDNFLIVYLPKERLLIEADSFTPGPPNSPPPAQLNPHHTNLVDNLQRLDLSVDRILPLHGRVATAAELYTAVGQTPPK